MKKNNFDERITEIELKISRFMYHILVSFLALSIIYQMFILKVSIDNYIFETIALIGINVLEIMAFLKSGIFNDGNKKYFYKKIFKDTLLSGILLAFIYFIIVGVDNYTSFIIMLLAYIILYMSFKIIANLYNCYKLDRIDEEINEYDD